MEFGINVHTLDGFAEHVRRADALGFDVFTAADHLGVYDPFAVLAAAAQISDRLRLRTYVLNAAFHRPAFVARSMQTLAAVSGGRAELGLGTGNVREEFEDAGLPFRPYSERLAWMEGLLDEVRARLAPARVPVAIGTNSERGLALAARVADIVAFSGLRTTRAGLRFVRTEDVAEHVALVRETAGDRPYVADVLLQAVTVDGDPRERAREWLGDGPEDLEEVLHSPFALFAPSPAAAAEELERRREAYGFTSFTAQAPSMEALGQVIAEMPR